MTKSCWKHKQETLVSTSCRRNKPLQDAATVTAQTWEPFKMSRTVFYGDGVWVSSSTNRNLNTRVSEGHLGNVGHAGGNVTGIPTHRSVISLSVGLFPRQRSGPSERVHDVTCQHVLVKFQHHTVCNLWGIFWVCLRKHRCTFKVVFGNVCSLFKPELFQMWFSGLSHVGVFNCTR